MAVAGKFCQACPGRRYLSKHTLLSDVRLDLHHQVEVLEKGCTE